MKRLFLVLISVLSSSPVLAEFGAPPFGSGGGFGTPFGSNPMNRGQSFNSPMSAMQAGPQQFARQMSMMAMNGQNLFGQNIRYKSKLPDFQKQMNEFLGQNQESLQQNLKAFSTGINGMTFPKPPVEQGLDPALAKALGPKPASSFPASKMADEFIASMHQMSETRAKIIQSLMTQTASFGSYGEPVLATTQTNQTQTISKRSPLPENSYSRRFVSHPARSTIGSRRAAFDWQLPHGAD